MFGTRKKEHQKDCEKETSRTLTRAVASNLGSGPTPSIPQGLVSFTQAPDSGSHRLHQRFDPRPP